MLAVALAAALAATPSPQQPALTQLKTIVHMRTTPFCSALRTHVGPAIEHVMQADRAIDGSGPLFSAMYRDDVVLRSGGRMDLDVQRMENLLTPIVSNIEAAEAELRDPQLADIAHKMQQVVDRQKAALNVVSGFVATYQLGQIQAAGPPENWAGVFNAAPPTRSPINGARPVTQADAAPRGAAALYGAGLPHTPSNPPAPAQQAGNVTLGTDLYAGYARVIATARKEGDDAEAAASQEILSAVARCAANP